MASAGKRRSIALLVLAQVAGMSLWFVSAAILPEIRVEAGLGPGRAAGWLADRIGKARVAQAAMIVSAGAALGTALAFGGPSWLFGALVLLWGAAVIPDSAQFSALVADAAPPERAGSLMTLQTALGFTLTFFTVQAVPPVAALIGWPASFAAMALGPMVGIEAMRRLIARRRGLVSRHPRP